MASLPDWNVYLPIQCLTERTGWLVGTSDETTRSLCVTGIDRCPDIVSVYRKRCGTIHVLGEWASLGDAHKSEPPPPHVVGGGGDCGVPTPTTTSTPTTPRLLITATKGYPAARVQNDAGVVGRCTVVLYNSDSLTQSFPLMCPAATERHDLVKRMSRSLNASYHEMPRRRLPHPRDGSPGSSRNFATRPREPDLRHRESPVAKFLVLRIYQLLTLVKSIFNCWFFQNKVIQAIANTPAVMLQITSRFNTLHSVVQPAKHVSAKQLLRRGDVLCGHLFDVCLGIVMMIVFRQYDTADILSEVLLHWADQIVRQLQQLLHWMTGEPGGLKLNNQLDQFLGKFFLYHIYLWTGYLQLLAPSMKTALVYIATSGCIGGVSMQLSLTQDMLSLMTLHIYCFYVYATKLYRLQLLALAALWRLFVGKKWNVLRKRVDSASFDVDQLFLGTLLFTILIFLMPTTAFFYTVFVMLRLLVLAAQGTLYKLGVVLNSLPLYKLYLRCMHPAAVADDIDLRVCDSSISETSICLHLKFIPMPLSTIFHQEINAFEVFDRGATYTWSNFLYSIIVGEIIYPWVRRRSSSADGTMT